MPKEYIPGVQKGLEMSKENGLLAGFPLIDFKATLIDGAYHDVDSRCWPSKSPRAPPSANFGRRVRRSCSSRS